MAEAQVDLDKTTIRAGVDGRVEQFTLRVGDVVNPVMRFGTLTTACTQGVNIGLTIFVPLYYELVHGLSASDSGLALIPIVMMTTPGSYLSGRAMLHLNRYKWVPLLMLSLATVALLALVVVLAVRGSAASDPHGRTAAARA